MVHEDTFLGTAARGYGLVRGMALCAATALAAQGLHLGAAALGWRWADALVLAILAGMAVRTVWTPGPQWVPGVHFGAKRPLETAIVLLGASTSMAAIARLEPTFLLAMAAIVVFAIVAGFFAGRVCGLSPRAALLIACGNAICGNSAIMAIAPVIRARRSEVVASITFTATLGVGLALCLPLLGALLKLSPVAYGTLAGLTVYAVPQVLAAASPFGTEAIEVGTITKLIRVLMLAPVAVVLSMVAVRQMCPALRSAAAPPLVPWFILGFIALLLLRSADVFPSVLLEVMASAAHAFTLVAMAALGLSVDLGSLARSGGRIAAAALLSLLILIGASVLFVWSLAAT